jgi:hypothetical protein
MDYFKIYSVTYQQVSSIQSSTEQGQLLSGLTSNYRLRLIKCLIYGFIFHQGDAGLIPRICEGLFSRIAGMTRWDEASFRTEVR